MLCTTNMFSENNSQSKARGMTCLQTDDTLTACNDAFLLVEETALTVICCKPIHEIGNENPLLFNGATISATDSSYHRSQDLQINNLPILDAERFRKEEYISQSVHDPYIASVYRPNLSFFFNLAVQVTEPAHVDVTKSTEAISHALSSKHQLLNFLPLKLSSINIAILVDASFASNYDSWTQFSFLTSFMDESKNYKIIHYSSSKLRLIAQSELATELFSSVYGFDYASTLQLAIKDEIGLQVPLRLDTDSKSLWDGTVLFKSTTRLLCQSYANLEIVRVLWIPSSKNSADALTKKDASSALHYLLAHNSMNLYPNSWIERPKSPKLESNATLEKCDCRSTV